VSGNRNHTPNPAGSPPLFSRVISLDTFGVRAPFVTLPQEVYQLHLSHPVLPAHLAGGEGSVLEQFIHGFGAHPQDLRKLFHGEGRRILLQGFCNFSFGQRFLLFAYIVKAGPSSWGRGSSSSNNVEASPRTTPRAAPKSW